MRPRALLLLALLATPLFAGGRYTITFAGGVSLEEARAAIARAGGVVDDPLADTFADFHRLKVVLPKSAAQALRFEKSVMAVRGPAPRMSVDNDLAAAASSVNTVQQPQYGLSGAGVVLSFFELGSAEAEHREFGGRLIPHFTGGIDREHATHVAGTMIAAGIDPRARGMAPTATLHEFNAFTDERVWLRSKEADLAPLGVTADNNSWGYILGWCDSTRCSSPSGWLWTGNDDLLGAYDFVAPDIDRIARTAPFLMVHSAGNDADSLGPAAPPFAHQHVDENGDTVESVTWCYSQNGSGTDCPSTPCTACEVLRHPPNGPFGSIGVGGGAKNVLTVGAIDAGGAIASFSSRGPERDGRLKPDVVAVGVGTYSTVLRGGYAVKNGTSMSTPVATGVAGLLAEEWRRTLGGEPPPVALKALIIAGADDLGTPGPDYTYGFGRVNARASADLILARSGIVYRETGSYETTFTIRQPQTVRVVLAWNDPPTPLATIAAGGRALVNDLDVQVLDPAGAVTRAYVLDRAQPSAPATRGKNSVDNVEMVELNAVSAGTYRVVVTAPAATQPYVLVANVPLGTAYTPVPPRTRAVRR